MEGNDSCLVYMSFCASCFISSVGNFENMSFNLSIGIVKKPTTVSYGGLLGEEGWGLPVKMVLRPPLVGSIWSRTSWAQNSWWY